MAIYSENKVSSVTITKQEEQSRTTELVKRPLKCSDRLRLVRRNLALGVEQARATQLAKECPYFPVPQTIALEMSSSH
jgi:hypothetical protein